MSPQPPSSTAQLSPSAYCDIDKVTSFATGQLRFFTLTEIASSQTLEMSLETDSTTHDDRACFTGSIAEHFFEPPFNIAIAIDISESTCGSLGGLSRPGDVNYDGIADSVLDSEIQSIINVLLSIADSTTLDNSNVKVGLIAFSNEGQLLGEFPPLDPLNGTQINPDLLSNLTSLQCGGETNYDGALDQVIEHFTTTPPGGDNLLFFLSGSVPNVSDDYPENPPVDNQPSALNYTVELATLDAIGVKRFAIGIGSLAEVTTGSGLDMIDNTPDWSTGRKGQLAKTTDALNTILFRNPVAGTITNLTVTVNGIYQPQFSVASAYPSPFGYSYGGIINNLSPTSGFENKVVTTMVINYSPKYPSTALTMTATAVVLGAGP